MTYLYCLVRSRRRPALRRRAAGLAAAGPLRALDAGGGLWLIVSAVGEDEYGEAAIARGLKNLEWVSRCALAHEAVIEQFLTAPALLPMQLFTIFASDERALAYVARARRRIDRVVARVAGQLEWGVRVTWDERAARASAGQPRAPRRAPASGAAYLARKREQLEAGRARLDELRPEATRLFRALAAQATSARRRTSTEQAAPGSHLLLDAAYLVPARRAAGFRAAVRRSARSLRQGLVVSLTGPWPPYNFIGSR